MCVCVCVHQTNAASTNMFIKDTTTFNISDTKMYCPSHRGLFALTEGQRLLSEFIDYCHLVEIHNKAAQSHRYKPRTCGLLLCRFIDKHGSVLNSM